MKNINNIFLFIILSVFSLVEVANSKVTETKLNDNLKKWTITENNQSTEKYFIRFVVPNSAPRKVLWIDAVKKIAQMLLLKDLRSKRLIKLLMYQPQVSLL